MLLKMLSVRVVRFVFSFIFELCFVMVMGQVIETEAQTVPAIVKKLAFEYLKKSAEQQKS